MDPHVRDLLAGLRTAESVSRQWAVVDDWVARRELEAGEFQGFAGLECLADATTARAWDAGVSDAFAVAFAAASTGGAYTNGRHGAYGRLAAWRTVGALAGAEPTAPFHEVSAAVSATRWFRFESDAPWFEGVAWDVGLAAEREDGRSLAVLAATDTD